MGAGLRYVFMITMGKTFSVGEKGGRPGSRIEPENPVAAAVPGRVGKKGEGLGAGLRQENVEPERKLIWQAKKRKTWEQD